MTSKNKHIAKTALSVHGSRRSRHCSIHVCSTRISQKLTISISKFARARYRPPVIVSRPQCPMPSASPQPPLIPILFFGATHNRIYSIEIYVTESLSLVTGRNFLVTAALVGV